MTDTTNPQQPEPWWAADGRLKPHALPAATTPDGPSLTGGFDDSVEIPDLPAVSVPASAPTDEAAEVAKHVTRAIFALKTPSPDGSKHYQSGWDDGLEAAMDAARDALLAVLPAPTTLSDTERQFLTFALDQAADEMSLADGFTDEDEAALEKLRRLADAVPVSGPGGAADETQAESQARLSHHRWYTETLDNAAAEWAPGMRFTNRAEALERYQAISERHPLWKDGTPVERRFVRETTSYTVEEPAAEPAPPVEHCIHDRTVHRTHHHTPVTGCPWCTAATSTEA